MDHLLRIEKYPIRNKTFKMCKNMNGMKYTLVSVFLVNFAQVKKRKIKTKATNTNVLNLKEVIKVKVMKKSYNPMLMK